MNTDLAAQHALTRLGRVGISGLTERERIVVTVWVFAAGVNNGGFEGYFGTERGDLAALAPNALRRIGAMTLAEIAAEANAVFGPSGPPTDCETRRTQMATLPASARAEWTEFDRQYVACDEDVDELLERFLG